MKLQLPTPAAHAAHAAKSAGRTGKAQAAGATASRKGAAEEQAAFGTELAEAQRSAAAQASLQAGLAAARPTAPAPAIPAGQGRPRAAAASPSGERTAAIPSPAVTALARRAASPSPLSALPAHPRLAAKAERKGARPAEPEKAAEQKPEPRPEPAARREEPSPSASATGRELAAQAQGASLTGETAVSAPAFELPALAAPVLTQAAEDPTLTAALLPGAAHLTCAVEGTDKLELHVRVRDGIADVRADGAAAAQLLNRVSQLEAALAGEGLQLGQFDLSQRGQSGADRTPDERPEIRPARKAVQAVQAPTGEGGGGSSRLHLKA